MNELYQIQRELENYLDKVNKKAKHITQIVEQLENHSELTNYEIENLINDISSDADYIIRETKH